METNLWLGLPTAMSLGFFFGMGPCILSCLPFLAPVFIAHCGGVKQSWRILLPHSLGRVTGYSLFGLAAGWGGEVINNRIDDTTTRLVLGIATLLVGLALMVRMRSSRGCPKRSGWGARLTEKCRGAARLLPDGLFFLGLSMSLAPCVPLNIVMLSAAATGDPWAGLILGLGFGLGAITVPALVYGLGVAYFGGRLRQQLGVWLPRIENLSAGLMILVGVGNLLRLAS
ncbi:sulfite exporter TauE/SafE family protein [Methylomonas sp. LWB]|uniref:sulfite exporter TauE/SafE family protein n=1 Tax=Methylomonas sp. LWB TaxID=1905845 RepID=UPI00111536FD|nr:sulfite exporter TauE/SafE family protein [Methylomonas sp. LWB]